MTGRMVEHLLSMVTVMTGSEDGSQRVKGQPPLPFNVAAFNDANETYSRLVYWARMFADIMGVPAPLPALRAWVDILGSIRGLPYDVKPGAARFQVQAMSVWLDVRLDDILAIRGDDIVFFLDDMKDLYRTAARWPMRQNPRRSEMPCPISECGSRITLYPPEEFEADEMIVCDRGHHIPLDKYEFYIRYYNEVQAERLRAIKVAKHLSRKYG